MFGLLEKDINYIIEALSKFPEIEKFKNSIII